ncbi:MAG TPA: hypothetical protein DCZ69_18005 [Syntrophobacteraceae bacterium]|nr:hypothetical protein [Syntrophobacteraceae bacterium]
MKPLRLLLGITISVVCLWLAVRNVPFSDLATALTGARCVWLALAVLVLLLAIIARAKLWATLLGGGVRLADSFWSEGIGYLFTNVLPLRMGEPARVFVMAKRSGLPIVQVATTAAIERLLDVIAILLALIAILPWMDVPHPVRRAGFAFGLVVLVVVLALIVLVRLNSRGERLLRGICGYLPFIPMEKTLIIWQELVAGTAILFCIQVAVRALVLSLATWTLSAGAYFCFLRSFQADATFVEAIFMLVAVCLAVSLPSSPGFIGVFQWVGQQALVLPFNNKYDHASALAITLTLHLITYVFTSLLGVIGLSRFGLSFVNLRKNIAEEPKNHKIEDELTLNASYGVDCHKSIQK